MILRWLFGRTDGAQALAESAPETVREAFAAAVSRYLEGGSPVDLRHLILATLPLIGDSGPLPKETARDIKALTKAQHRTWGTAATAVLGLTFEGSGRYWATFLVGRSLGRFPEERADRDLEGYIADLIEGVPQRGRGGWRRVRWK